MITVVGTGLTAVVDPTRGAKITSLRDAAGLEWLAQPADVTAREQLKRPRRPAFVDAEMAGWDECAPTIVACRVDGCDLPDHGDLWDAAFDIEPDGTTVHTVGASLGYRFRRGVRSTPTGLRLDYEAEAIERPVPFLWAAHPQFVAPPGTRVELAGVEPDRDRVVDVIDDALPDLVWNAGLATIDTVEPGGFRKVYAHPGRPVHAARLVRADGGALALRWSSACPYVGVWFDHAAFSREPVIAIEPSTAYFDALDTAVRLGRAPLLRPGHPLRWWVGLDAT